MDNTTVYYFAGRCLAKLAALECLHWNKWDHQLHLSLMKRVEKVVESHEELANILDELQTYIENQDMALSDVLTNVNAENVARYGFEAMRAGVQDELMSIRSYQREVLGQAEPEPVPF
jgi:hypothetical protein